MKCWAIILSGFVGLILLLFSKASADTYTGLIIRDIQISCISDRELDEALRKEIHLKIGSPFSQEAIRESVRAIYALKHFSQITVEAERVDGGVRLSLCPERVKILSTIQIRGNKAVSTGRIQDAIGFRTGERLPTRALSAIRQRLLRLYREQGYHQIQIALHTMQSSTSSEKFVLFVDIQEGFPSKIGSIAFYGQSAFGERELLKASKLRRGKHFTLEALEEAEKLVKHHYSKHGYFAMKFRERDIQYHYESGETNLGLAIEEGNAAQVSFWGNSQIKTKELLRQLDLFTPAGIDQKLLDKSVHILREYYRVKGYHFAHVNSQYTIEENAPIVTFFIEEGPQVRLERIDIDGNHSIGGEAIRRALLSKAERLFSKGLYREEVLALDVLAVKALYQQHGFLTADVVARQEFRRGRSRLVVRLGIEEGIQTRIEEIRITGEDDPKVERALRKQLPFHKGEPLNTPKLPKSGDALRDAYINQGYLGANVDMKTQFSPDRSQVTIVYQVKPGEQLRIGKIQLEGIERTRERFVTRELLVEEGDVYYPQKVRETSRRLLRTGLYDSVIFRRLDLTSVEPVQDMLLKVREAQAKRIRLGGGYSTIDDFKVWIEYANRNVFNFGGKGTIRTELSTQRPKVTLQYIQPHFFNRDTSLLVSLFDEIQKDNASYDTESRGGRLGFSYDFTETLSATTAYFFEHDEPSAVKDDAILSPLDTSTLELAGPMALIRWDTRDDVLLPKKGNSSFLAAGTALKSFGSEEELLEIRAQSKWFFPMFEELVFAFSLTGQAIDPIGRSEAVPIYKRYFLGGDISQNGSVRGFKKHEIGPSGEEGSKIGGDRLYAFNTELRFPIYRAFGGVVFYDTGANWLADEGYDPGERREAAGAGLRLKTPVGPLRFDYGWKIDRRPGESSGEVIFSIGSAF